MIDEESLFIYLFTFLLGSGLSFLLFSLFLRKKIGSIDQYQQKQARLSETKAQELLQNSEQQANHQLLQRTIDIEKKASQARAKLEKEEARLREREDRLDDRFTTFEKKCNELERKELELAKEKKKLEEKAHFFQEKNLRLHKELEKLSSLTCEEAEARLFEKISLEKEESWNDQFRRRKAFLEQESDTEASRILALACQRMAGKTALHVPIAEIPLPDPDLRGRIIGREGRNIQLIERLTGTTIIIEDRHNRLLLSCYDPTRREIAKHALELLIQDGRIHPTSIEEAVSSAKESVQKTMRKKAEEALTSLGIKGLHPALKETLALCSLRTSLGQNILDHLIEVAHFMGQMAYELSLDVELAKRIGLLHDIGKAAPKEMEGPHDLVGGELARKYGESPKVINGIESHHGRCPPLSAEAILCKGADTLSASRPGARSENSEKQALRSELMEKVALNFPGIERAHALQAGRELHLFVNASKVDDAGVEPLARDIKRELQKNPDLPGQIKLVILREKKAVELAL